MGAAFSIYLDIVRFVAALAVVFDHLASPPYTVGALWAPLGGHGSSAVTVFFVLSGYVIAHVAATREPAGRLFVASRVARLYAVVVVALPLTLLLDLLGQHLAPDFYAVAKVLAKPESWQGYLASLCLVNEWQVFGFNGIAPGTNNPWWSLSFEATYYALAALVLFRRPAVWLPAGALILWLAGRTITALAPLWLLGFVLYHAPRLGFGSRRRTAAVCLLLSGLALLAMPTLEPWLPTTIHRVWLPWGRWPLNRNLVADYATGALCALHLVAARSWLDGRAAPGARRAALVRRLGTLTYPLYLMHYPIVCLLCALPWWGATASSTARALAILALTLAVVAALTPLTEYLRGRIKAGLVPPTGIEPVSAA